MSHDRQTTAPLREVPVDWEALEDAFENNAPEVHSYLHLTTGEVLRVVDGVADPQMHARISADPNYLRIDPVSSREQYRWMERFIPMVDDVELRGKLAHAIDGKGAFRRFKDVLMTYAADRERWFAFRSERLRTFMEAWLNAHAIQAVPRPGWVDEPPVSAEETPDSAPTTTNHIAAVPGDSEPPRSTKKQGQRNTETMRTLLREIAENLGARELETLVSFAEFLKARRAARAFAQQHHQEHAAVGEPAAIEKGTSS
jgi:hypothetical protein